MITEDERQSIINEAVEKAILSIPDIIGNLIMTHISSIKMNRVFYDKFPEFKDSKDVVAAVVERLESENPGVDYKALLDKAAPVVREQISKMKVLDKTTVVKPNRNLLSLNLPNNGEL